MGKFSGTVTFITGASSGIGAALAIEIAGQGGDLALAARREERLREVAEQIARMGRVAFPIKCDVTRDGDVEKALGEAGDFFGQIDYVVANAGFGVAGRVERLSLDDYRRQFETNIFGVLRTVQAARGYLAKSKGCLGIIGSVNGYIAIPGLSAYCMSKFAVHGLAEALCRELAPQGIGVVLVAPGLIESEIRQVDRKGVFHPDALDRSPVWLRMPAYKAARKIARALQRRKRLQVISAHARLAVFLKRHFPGIINFALDRFNRKK